MKKAYQNLMEKKENEGTDNARIIEDSLDIEVTDYYVKFLVENDDQVNLLLSDSLNLSFFPLDVELDDNLDYYANENTETQEAYWLYTAVQKDYQFHPDNYSDDLVQPEGFSLYYTFTEEDYNLEVDCE